MGVHHGLNNTSVVLVVNTKHNMCGLRKGVGQKEPGTELCMYCSSRLFKQTSHLDQAVYVLCAFKAWDDF